MDHIKIHVHFTGLASPSGDCFTVLNSFISVDKTPVSEVKEWTAVLRCQPQQNDIELQEVMMKGPGGPLMWRSGGSLMWRSGGPLMWRPVAAIMISLLGLVAQGGGAWKQNRISSYFSRTN